ncbi:MAG TPA: nucleotidyltransferase domain-containing protein [Methylomirabilota bacterium]|nr:nucleotidyltransferase domain-containing protein [Methylomirabilota bacterium]
MHKIADRVEPYLRVLVQKIHPEKIILFGSQAYGDPTANSDVDLLVVRADKSGKESNLEIREAFWSVDAPPTSFTLLSRTPQEVANQIAAGSPIYKDILAKGLLLYAA